MENIKLILIGIFIWLNAMMTLFDFDFEPFAAAGCLIGAILVFWGAFSEKDS
jgi:hypothetical protein